MHIATNFLALLGFPGVIDLPCWSPMAIYQKKMCYIKCIAHSFCSTLEVLRERKVEQDEQDVHRRLVFPLLQAFGSL